MLEVKNFMPINFLKKEKFTGSFHGMRYRMEKAETEEGSRLGVCIWPEPYSYDATEEEGKERMLFSFDEEGIVAGVDWLNERYESEKEKWKETERK